jgi:hypothetical protein
VGLVTEKEATNGVMTTRPMRVQRKTQQLDLVAHAQRSAQRFSSAISILFGIRRVIPLWSFLATSRLSLLFAPEEALRASTIFIRQRENLGRTPVPVAAESRSLATELLTARILRGQSNRRKG